MEDLKKIKKLKFVVEIDVELKFDLTETQIYDIANKIDSAIRIEKVKIYPKDRPDIDIKLLRVIPQK